MGKEGVTLSEERKPGAVFHYEPLRKENAMMPAVSGGLLSREHSILHEVMKWSDPADFIASALSIAEEMAESYRKALGFPRPLGAQLETQRQRDSWLCAVLALTSARDMLPSKE